MYTMKYDKKYENLFEFEFSIKFIFDHYLNIVFHKSYLTLNFILKYKH